MKALGWPKKFEIISPREWVVGNRESGVGVGMSPSLQPLSINQLAINAQFSNTPYFISHSRFPIPHSSSFRHRRDVRRFGDNQSRRGALTIIPGGENRLHARVVRAAACHRRHDDAIVQHYLSDSDRFEEHRHKDLSCL